MNNGSKMDYKYCVNPKNRQPEAYERAVFDFICYYEERAKFYKKWYSRLSIIKMFLLVFIPVSQVVPVFIECSWISTIASSLCIMIETTKEMFHMRKKWILYQHTNNLLMSEQRQYRSAAGEYATMSEQEKFVHFVNCVEKIIGNESDVWKEMLSSYKDKEE